LETRIVIAISTVSDHKRFYSLSQT